MTQRTSKLLVESVQDTTVISFLENSILDAAQILEIDNELKAVIEARKPRKLVLDFEQVRFLSSQALGLLITVQKRLRNDTGGAMKVAAMRADLRQVFRITKLDKLFDFYPTIDEAVKSFSQPSVTPSAAPSSS